MKNIIELKNGEDILAVDCENKKVYFNGNEVVKISFNFDGGKFLDYAYCNMLLAAVNARAVNFQKYVANNFVLYALTYKDNANKEHLVVEEYGNWNEVDSWDKIDVRPDHEFNESFVVYGINDGKKVDTIVLEKISLFGFSIDDINNADTINLGYSVCR